MIKTHWPNGTWFQMYNGGTTEDQAREMFQQRYGYKPEHVFLHGTAIYAGPALSMDTRIGTGGAERHSDGD